MQFKKLIAQSIIWRGLYFLSVFVLNVLISRYFHATGSGWVYYISNNFAFFILIAGLCLESGTSFYGSKKEIAYHKLSLLSMSWAVIVSLVMIAIVRVAYNDPGEEKALRFYTYFSLTYGSGVMLTTYYTALFYAKQDFITPNLVLVSTNFALILLLPLAERVNESFISNQYLNFYFLTFLLQGLLIALAFTWKYTARHTIELPGSVEFKKILQYSLFSLLANVIFFLLYRMDYWFVKNFCKVCAPGDLGNYIQVSKLVQVFLVLPAIISSTVFPRTAAGFREEMNASIQVLSRIIFLFYLLLLVILAITGKWLFPFIFGNTFNHMFEPFLLLIPGVLSLSVLSFLAAYNAGKGKISTNLKGAIVPLVVIISGDIFFIPLYGIEAAALVSSIGYTCYLIYVLLIFKREYNVSMIDFFLFKKEDWHRLKKLVQEALVS